MGEPKKEEENLRYSSLQKDKDPAQIFGAKLVVEDISEDDAILPSRIWEVLWCI